MMTGAEVDIKQIRVTSKVFNTTQYGLIWMVFISLMAYQCVDHGKPCGTLGIGWYKFLFYFFRTFPKLYQYTDTQCTPVHY